MKVAKHITFFYKPERVQYIQDLVNNADSYTHHVDIFIHTNVNTDVFCPRSLPDMQNGSVRVIVHDITHEDPFYLSWKCRSLIREQVVSNAYDVYIYVEDDILVPRMALEYWLAHKHIASDGYNLGFLRIEINEQKHEVITDITTKLPLNNVNIDGKTYVVNGVNPYCAFWIYDQETMQKWIDSTLWYPGNVVGYGIREKSAVALHGVDTAWFKGTVLPLSNTNDGIDPGCRVYHLQTTMP